MKDVTKLMINDYKILEVGMDFMGYRVTKEKGLSFHHLVVPKRKNGKYEKENGAILIRYSSHDYLHAIERVDLEVFNYITSEMIDENIKGFIDMANIKRIDDLLCYFEDRHKDDTTKKGHILIKDVYRRRVLEEERKSWKILY